MNPQFHLTLGEVKDISTIIGFSFGSLWAIYKFVVTKPLVWRMNIIVEFASPQFIVDEEQAIVVVKVTLQNVGPTKLVPGPSGLVVSVREIPFDASLTEPVVTWDHCKVVIEEFDVLAQYRPSSTTSYEDVISIDPGVSYFEPVALRLRRKRTYMVKVNYWHKKNSDNIVNFAHVQCA